MFNPDDVGRFAVLPEWVFNSGVSKEALALYVLLGYYVNHETGECWPSKGTLAERMGASPQSIRRWTLELVAVDALQIAERIRPDGGASSNMYRLRYARPGAHAEVVPEFVVADPLLTRDKGDIFTGEEGDIYSGEDIRTKTTTNKTAPIEIGTAHIRANDVDGSLSVALQVYHDRTQDGSLPVGANKGRLIALTKEVVAKVGSEKAYAVMMGLPDFTPGCVNFALSQNGHQTKAEKLTAANKAKLAKLKEKA